MEHDQEPADIFVVGTDTTAAVVVTDISIIITIANGSSSTAGSTATVTVISSTFAIDSISSRRRLGRQVGGDSRFTGRVDIDSGGGGL